MSRRRIKYKKLEQDYLQLQQNSQKEKQDLLNQIDDLKKRQAISDDIVRKVDEIQQVVKGIDKKVEKEKPTIIDWIVDFPTTFVEFVRNHFGSTISIILIVIMLAGVFVISMVTGNIGDRVIDKTIPVFQEEDAEIDRLNDVIEQLMRENEEQDKTIRKQSEIIDKQAEMILEKDKLISEKDKLIESLIKVQDFENGKENYKDENKEN